MRRSFGVFVFFLPLEPVAFGLEMVGRMVGRLADQCCFGSICWFHEMIELLLVLVNSTVKTKVLLHFLANSEGFES